MRFILSRHNTTHCNHSNHSIFVFNFGGVCCQKSWNSKWSDSLFAAPLYFHQSHVHCICHAFYRSSPSGLSTTSPATRQADRIVRELGDIRSDVDAAIRVGWQDVAMWKYKYKMTTAASWQKGLIIVTEHSVNQILWYKHKHSLIKQVEAQAVASGHT